MNTNEEAQNAIVAHCGLVCSECGMFKKSKCKGCYGGKPMFQNCPIKKCCIDNHLATCAECVKFPDLKDCRKLNNLISKFFSMIFRTNRIANLEVIRKVGLEKFRSLSQTAD